MGKTVEVQTEELGAVVVHKLTLGDYAELLKSIKTLGAKIQELIGGKTLDELSKMKNEDFIKMAPSLIADAFPEMVSALSRCTDKSVEDIQKLDLSDALDVVAAAIELNDYSKVIEKVKKLMARRGVIPAADDTPSTNG